MRPVKYLKDKISLILVFYISILFTIIISSLSSLNSGHIFEGSDIVYAFFLSTIFLGLYLIFDYRKTNSFIKVLDRRQDDFQDMQYIYNLPDGLSNQYDILKSAYIDNYNYYIEIIERQRKSNKLQNEFNNRWIHEMKTPVSVLKLLMEREIGINGKSEIYNQMGEEMEKLSNGLELALYTLRIKDFEQDFKVEDVELVSLIRAIINENKSTFIVNKVYPKLLFNEEIYIKSDKKWLKFIVSQILNNSIKYTGVSRSDLKEIKIDLFHRDSNKILVIEDNGVGIESEEISRIFNPFFTGTNGRKYSESTGMGLYLVKEVLERLGHSIEVESTVDIGTKIFIVFHSNKSIYNL